METPEEGSYIQSDFSTLECNLNLAPGNLAEHAQKLLELMQSPDEMEVLQGAMQFSMHLAVAPEEAFGSIPLESVVATLVESLHRALPDTSLYSIMSLNHIMDSVPNSAGIVAASGGVPTICSKLMSFEYIDMAEHAIKALERLSYDNSTAILQEGAFTGLVNLLDFFDTNTQKRILTIAAVVARSVSSEDLVIQYILPVLPVVSSLLQFKGVEYLPTNELALNFYGGLVESVTRLSTGDFERAKANAQMVAENGLLQNLVELLPNMPHNQGSILDILSSLCSMSPQIVLSFHNLGATSVIKEGLEQSKSESTKFIEALQLVDSMIPNKNTQSELDTELIQIYKEMPELLRSLGEMVFPKIIALYEKVVNKGLRNLVLKVLEKLIEHSERDLVVSYTTPGHFSTFLSELLSCKDIEAVKSALSIVNSLYEKIPKHIATNLVREGVTCKLENLTNEAFIKELTFPSQFMDELVGASSNNEIRRILQRAGVPRNSPFLQEILRQIKRRRNREEEKPNLDNVVSEMSQEVLQMASKAFQSSKQHPQASGLLEQLKTLSSDFEQNKGSNHVSRLARLISNEEGLTLHEIVSSKVVESLWDWLVGSFQKNPKLALSRIHTFLSTFLENSKGSENLLSAFVKLLTKVVRYTQQFSILLYESPGNIPNSYLAMRTLSNRVRLVFQYDSSTCADSEEVQKELQEKHQLFSDIGSFSIAVEQYQSFEIIYDALLRINSRENLDLLMSSFERTNSEARGINHGQLNLVKQHLRLQQLLSTDPSQLGIRTDGNEQALKELEERRQQIMEKLMSEDDKEEDELLQPITSYRKNSALSTTHLELELFLGQGKLSKRMTVFEAMNKFLTESSDTLSIRFCFKPKGQTEDSSSQVIYRSYSMLGNIIQESSSLSLSESESIFGPMRLLKFLSILNSQLPQLLSASSQCFYPNNDTSFSPLKASDFVSEKLSALAAKQTSDLLAMVGGMAPEWVRTLPRTAFFLFNFNVRLEVFRSLCFNGGRALYLFSNKGRNFNVRMLRQKAMIPREKVLEAGMRILGDTALMKFGILEFDFSDEEGTGTGPTLEFYTLIGREVRKLGIWRNTGEASGLFPAPIQSLSPSETSKHFEFIGKLVAKALFDDKLIDLPLSQTFWKLVLRKPVYFNDLKQVDSQLHKHLLELQELVNRRNWIIEQQQDCILREKHLRQVTLKGAEVEDLQLYFLLPGYDIELKPNGKNIQVTLDNLEEYIELVVEYTLAQTYSAEAFRKGLEKLIPLEALEVFYLEEIEFLTCGKGTENWQLSELKEAVLPAHGFTYSSSSYLHLLEFMQSLDSQQKRLFLQFCTGCPRLPIGGFKSLQPPLTVVRKVPSDPSDSPDSFLPSVMTCQNYLKLPEYSSYDMLKKNLLYAIQEGHETFHLS